MQNAVLLLSVMAALAFGWYMAGKLDAFLNRIPDGREEYSAAEDTVLRIGFLDPMTAGSVSGMLETYCKTHPYVSVSLVSGREEELLKEFRSCKLDVIFFPQAITIPEKVGEHIDEISLRRMPVTTQYGGLPIAPIAADCDLQKMVWTKSGTTEVNRFVQYIARECKMDISAGE